MLELNVEYLMLNEVLVFVECASMCFNVFECVSMCFNVFECVSM